MIAKNHTVGETPPPRSSRTEGSRLICDSAEETFQLGEEIGRGLTAGDVVLLYGGLGAGKTLLTKGILNALDFDVDEVTSPSFTLVNLYKTASFDVYHIDLWRLDGGQDAAAAVGLYEILEKPNIVTIIEWADRLSDILLPRKVLKVRIDGNGSQPRDVTIESKQAEKS